MDAYEHFKRQGMLDHPNSCICMECPDRKQCHAGDSTCPSELRVMNKDGATGHIIWVKETTAVIAALED